MLTMTGWEDLPELARAFAEAETAHRVETLKLLAEEASATIVDRTLDHKDKYGNEFEPYSTSPTSFGPDDPYYEKALQSGGEQTKSGIVLFSGGYQQFKAGLGSSQPNLFVLGELLGLEGHARPFGLSQNGGVDADKFSATIDFSDSSQAQKADDIIQGNGQPMRDFWGAADSDKEVEDLSNFVVDRYQAFIDKEFEAMP